MWQQRSRVRWLKEGDGNTSSFFFNRIANFHRKMNFIPSIEIDNNTLEDPLAISQAFLDFYISLIGTASSCRFSRNWAFLYPPNEQVDLSSLDLPFIEEEVKCIVFELAGDKALGMMASLLSSIKFFVRRLCLFEDY